MLFTIEIGPPLIYILLNVCTIHYSRVTQLSISETMLYTRRIPRVVNSFYLQPFPPPCIRSITEPSSTLDHYMQANSPPRRLYDKGITIPDNAESANQINRGIKQASAAKQRKPSAVLFLSERNDLLCRSMHEQICE